MRLAAATIGLLATSAVALAAAVGATAATGKTFIPVVPVQLYQPVGRYTLYVDKLLKELRPQLQALQSAADAGNRQESESAWLSAHMTWLRIGQDDNAYGAFGNLGEEIDGQAAGLPGTTSSPSFTGFHKIEFDLWHKHDTSAAAADTANLMALTARLTPRRVESDLPLTVVGLDAWILRCHEVLEDAVRDSLTQNDDYGSNSDLASLAADVSATREFLNLLAPLIEQRAPKVVVAGSSDLSTLSRAISSAGGPVADRSLLSLRLRTRQELDSAAGAAVETLAPVSDLMYITAPGA